MPVRHYLGQNLHAGLAETVNIAVRMTASEIVKGANGGPIPDEAVKIDFALRDAELAVAEGLPPLSRAAVSGTVTGTTAFLQASGARVQMPDGRTLAISEGSFGMAELLAEGCDRPRSGSGWTAEPTPSDRFCTRP